jgi:hypothetical protein
MDMTEIMRLQGQLSDAHRLITKQRCIIHSLRQAATAATTPVAPASQAGGADPVAWRVTYARCEPPTIWQNGKPDEVVVTHCAKYGHRLEYAYAHPPTPASAAVREACSCVYATNKNTASVRAGHEMGGYIKEECTACNGKKPAAIAEPVVDGHLDMARKITAAKLAAKQPAIPAGDFVLVPREPTEAMQSAGLDAFCLSPGIYKDADEPRIFADVYRAMIAAAPKDGGA